MPSPGSRSSQWWPSAAPRVVAAGSRTSYGFLLVGAADGFVPDSAECKMGSCAMGPTENRSGDPDPSAESPPAPSSRPFKRRAVELGRDLSVSR